MLPRILRWLRGNTREAEMAEELQHHLELQTAENVRRGMSPEEARYAALRAFGGVEQVKERCRDERIWGWLAQFRQDVGYGLRSLRKHMGFTAAAVLTLAIGVGVNTTVISAINDMIWRPVAPGDGGALVVVRTKRVESARTYRPFTYREYEALRATASVFDDLAAMQFGQSLVGQGDDAQRRLVCIVSGNYFSVLGIAPWRGRFFTAEESDPALDRPVLVAGYELWRALGARDDFVGSQVRVDGRRYTVVGIAPPGFGGLQWSIGPYAWLPLGAAPHLASVGGVRAPSRRVTDPNAKQLQLFGRLQDGLSRQVAQERLVIFGRDFNAHEGLTGTASLEFVVAPPPRTNLDLTTPMDESGLALYAFAGMAMTLTVLLVACVNVANMLLGRGVSLRKEIAIRLCLGASRARIVRQLLVEGLLLALLGSVLGLFLSRWSNDVLLEFTRPRSGGSALYLRTSYDWPILAGTFGLALLATLGVALVPAIQATRRDLVSALKQSPSDVAAATRADRGWSWRQGLVVVQVALSLALIFCAGVLVHAVVASERDCGFDTDRQLIVNVDYGLAGTPAEAVKARQRALWRGISRMEGVEKVALAGAVPFNFQTNWRPVFRAGDTADHPAICTAVTNAYFETLAVPLLRGRDFTATEAVEGQGRSVAVIDETLGRTLFGDRDPVGQFIALNRPDPASGNPPDRFEVVGVVRSPREDAFQPAAPYPRLYLPFARASVLDTYVHLKLQPGTNVSAALERVRREMRGIDPQTPVLACEPLATFVAKNLNVWTARLLAGMFTVFGFVAVVLAVIGVYGVKAYLVACRTQEIGIRIAIGARPVEILGLFLRRSLWQTGIGVVIGVALALLAGQGLAKLFYGVGPVDVFTLVGAVLLVASASILACLVPALRATRVSPLEALRAE